MNQARIIMRRTLGPLTYRVAARGAGSLMQAVSLVILARQVGVGAFGALSLGLSIAAIVGTALGVGSSGRALRLGREDDSGSTATSMFVARGVSASISGLAAAGVALILRENAASAISLAAIVLADQTCELEQAILAGRQRQFASANWVVLQRLIPLLLILVGGRIGLPTVVAYGIGSVIVLTAVSIRPIRQWVHPTRVTALMRQSSGYWAASLMGSISSLDLTVARIFGGPIPAGLYGAANRATNPISIFVAELLIIITPAASKAETPERRGQILRISMGVSIALGIPLIALSPVVSAILVSVLGPQYAAARTIITAFVVAAAISGVSQTIQARLYTEGRPVVAAVAIGAGTAVGLGILAFAGGFYGSTLLWVVPVSIQVLVLALLLFGARRTLGSIWP